MSETERETECVCVYVWSETESSGTHTHTRSGQEDIAVTGLRFRRMPRGLTMPLCPCEALVDSGSEGRQWLVDSGSEGRQWLTWSDNAPMHVKLW